MVSPSSLNQLSTPKSPDPPPIEETATQEAQIDSSSFLDELRLDGVIPSANGASETESNSFNDDFVTIDIKDDSVIPVETPAISHYVFLVLLFRIQRVVVAFSKWAGNKIFSQKSMEYFRWDDAKAAILVYYNPETGQKREVDLVFDIPTIDDLFEFRLQLLVEHKSYPDDEEPLQSTGYVNLMYRKQAAEQKGKRIANGGVPGQRIPIRLDPVVRIKLYNGESPDMGITRFAEYFAHLPKEVLDDLRPYISMNDPISLNLRTLPLEEFPGSSDTPELFLGLKTMRDVLGANQDQLLDENFDWLIAHADTFDSERDYYEFGSLIIRYMDHYQKNFSEGKLEQVDKKFQHSMEDHTMPSVLERYYKEGLQKGWCGGRQEGMQEGMQKGVVFAQKAVIRCLRRRFGEVPEDIVQHVKGMSDFTALESLEESVFECSSLEEFRKQL